MTSPDRAGAPEPEITEEMIEAGLDVLSEDPWVADVLPTSVARTMVREMIERIWKVRASGTSQAK
jgi:hypothetical protein